MLIPPSQLRRLFSVRPSGVLHVGAHKAQEFRDYHQNSFGKVLWVEAQENLIPELVNKVCGAGDAVFKAVVWSESGVQLDFNVANNSQSSSLFDFADHKDFHPEVSFLSRHSVMTIRLDELIPRSETFDFVNLDIQGAELEALRGLGKRLEAVRWVYCEVNWSPLYEGIPLVGEIDEFMEAQGFTRVVTVWRPENWGDALYVRSRGTISDKWLRLRGRLYETASVNRHLSRVRSLHLLLRKTIDGMYLRILRR